MDYKRMAIEVESPEERGYASIQNNLAESSVADRTWASLDTQALNTGLKDFVLAYGSHRGAAPLRAYIAGISYSPDQVLVTAGAAAALFIIHTTLLTPQDHLVVLYPNYGTNLETPRAIGCQISTVNLSFESDWGLTIADIQLALRPNTKLLSLTYPHNPTGKCLAPEIFQTLVDLAETRGFYILVDETYGELPRLGQAHAPLPQYSLLSKSPHVIYVASLSKAYGVPGLRIGWLKTTNEVLLEQFLAAKEQIMICNSILDETLACHVLAQKEALLAPTYAHIQANFALLSVWIEQQNFLEWQKPEAGVVCFPRFKAPYASQIEADFYEKLLVEYGTMLGPGHWFGFPDAYFRLGFGYPSAQALTEGLNALEACFKAYMQEKNLT